LRELSKLAFYLAQVGVYEKTLLIVFVVLVFFGCKSHIKATNNIIPLGLDTYTVSYSGRPYSTVKTIVYKAATQHCEKQEKMISFQNEGQQREWGWVSFGGFAQLNDSVTLDFRCLRRDDPEFRSPDGRKPPNPVKENSSTQ